MDWTLLWKLMLVVMLGLFAVMAVFGTILGGRDVRRLLKHLRQPEADEETETETEATPPSD
ncbi:MAG: hypothetical protein WD342_12360 [Verrucomicrobiales bacterium]